MIRQGSVVPKQGSHSSEFLTESDPHHTQFLLCLSSLFIFSLYLGKAIGLSQQFCRHLAGFHAVSDLKQSANVSKREQVGKLFREQYPLSAQFKVDKSRNVLDPNMEPGNKSVMMDPHVELFFHLISQLRSWRSFKTRIQCLVAFYFVQIISMQVVFTAELEEVEAM